MRHAGKMWLVGLLLVATPAFGQSAPPAPNRPWSAGGEVLGETRPGPALRFDPTKTYSLAELIDLAQRHNPDTRVSWERARAQAAALGVARSELYPTLTAAALTRANRSEVLVEPDFRREDIRSAGLAFDLTYMVFDFGGRAGRIDAARAETLAANFASSTCSRWKRSCSRTRSRRRWTSRSVGRPRSGPISYSSWLTSARPRRVRGKPALPSIPA